MKRTAMLTIVLAAGLAGGLTAAAGAQTAGLTNGGFETPSPFGGIEPLGWHNISGPGESRFRRVGDGQLPTIEPVGTPGAITPRTGEGLVSIGTTGTAAEFRGFTTDIRNFFAPGFPFYDPIFDYDGGHLVIEGWYFIPESDPVTGQRVAIKMNIKGAGDPNQDNAASDPWSGFGGPNITFDGHTSGQWHFYRTSFCMDVIHQQVEDNVIAGHFTIPPNPNRVKITIGRFGLDGVATGTVFWDDVTFTQLAVGEPCPAPFAGPIAPSCPADFNGDGFVDPDDLSDFITCFFLDVQFPGTCAASDFNGDGFRDPDDLSDFITAFFTSTC